MMCITSMNGGNTNKNQGCHLCSPSGACGLARDSPSPGLQPSAPACAHPALLQPEFPDAMPLRPRACFLQASTSVLLGASLCYLWLSGSLCAVSGLSLCYLWAVPVHLYQPCWATSSSARSWGMPWCSGHGTPQTFAVGGGVPTRSWVLSLLSCSCWDQQPPVVRGS